MEYASEVVRRLFSSLGVPSGPLSDVLQYRGKRVVVTGCASETGAVTARILMDLGASVVGLDVGPCVGFRDLIRMDLRSEESVDSAVAAVGGPVDAIFNIAGLPGPPHPDIDTLLVNFVGARHLIESLVPVMPAGSGIVCLASNAGLGWQQEIPELLEVTSRDGFDAARSWCEANPSRIAGGCPISKKLINAWVASRAVDLIKEGIRLNCTNPGPAEGRSTAEEQAWPLVFLNSPLSSYITGEALHTDGVSSAPRSPVDLR